MMLPDSPTEDTVMQKIRLLLLAAALVAPVAQAEGNSEAPARNQSMTGYRCLTPGPATGWTYLDDSHILIDGGRYKYSMEFSDPCWGIKFDNSLAFKGDTFNGRVCGDLGDQVITERMHCQIKHMEIISTAQYRQIIKDNKDAIAAKKAAKKAKAP